MKKKEKRMIIILIIISILIIGTILIFKNRKKDETITNNETTIGQVQSENVSILPSEMDNTDFLKEMEEKSKNEIKEQPPQKPVDSSTIMTDETEIPSDFKTEDEEVIEDYVEVIDDDNKINNSEKLKETKNFNGLKFENSTLVKNSYQTLLKANVKNDTGRDIDVTEVDVILLDKEGKEIITLGGIISPIKNGETTEFITSMSSDFTNAYDYKIVKK